MKTTKYRCASCCAWYKSKFCMSLHQRLHKKTLKNSAGFQCSFCKKQFVKIVRYQWHLVYHGIFSTKTSSRNTEKRDGGYRPDICQSLFRGSHKHKVSCMKKQNEKPWKYRETLWSRNIPNHCYLQVHENVASFKFESCKKGLIKKQDQILHCDTDTGNQSNIRNKCGEALAGKHDLAARKYTSGAEQTFACDKCGKRFTYLKSLLKHSCLVICGECGRGFKAKRVLNQHLKRHSLQRSGERPFACDKCGKGFRYKANLTSHSLIHLGERPFVCSECGRSFLQKRSLRDHSYIHSGERPYTCKECGKGFTKRQNLVDHIFAHSGEKPYCCNDCGKGFAQKKGLVAHSRIHSGEIPFVCNECGKCFLYKGSLIAHTLKHSGEQPFVCDQCGKKFFPKSRLTKHKVTCTG